MRTTRRPVAVRRSAVLVAVALVVALLPAGALADHRETDDSDGLVTSVRWPGDTRFDTAARIAVEFTASSVADPSTSAVLATGANFPDALAGSYLAGVLDAPIVLTRGDELPDETLDVLTGDADDPDAETLAVDTVYLLGGPTAIGPAVEDRLEDEGIDVVRIAGGTRIDTAARIATEAPDATVGTVDGLRTAVLARADDFPDALVAGAGAVDASLPLLLTDTGALPDATRDALAELDVEQVVIAGGPVAVSPQVEARLVDLGYQVRRVFGGTRTDTAVAFAAFHRQDLDFATDEVGLARADDFPDALALAAFAGRERFSVVLARDPNTLDVATRNVLAGLSTCDAETLYVPGGPVAISDTVEQIAREAMTTNADCSAVDTTGPTLAAAAVESLGSDDSSRALPGPDDARLVATFDEPVTCDGDVPQQFTLAIDDELVAATSLACSDTAAVEVLLGFPGGSVTTLEDVTLRYEGAGSPTARVTDLAGNEALPSSVDVTEAVVVNTRDDAPDADVGDGECAIADGGRCSLRAAVQEASAASGPTVVLVPGGTFRLTVTGSDEDDGARGDLDITGSVALLGRADTVVVQTVADRVLDVRSGTSAISGLTLTGGDAVGDEGRGGGIRVAGGGLGVVDVTVRDNDAGQAGGGVANDAVLALLRTTLTDNTAGTDGGGLDASADATTTLTDGTVADNVAGGAGGGVANAGELTVSATTVDGNVAERSGGGVEHTSGALVVRDATLRDNDAGAAPGNGGGLHTAGGATVASGTLVTSNEAVEGGGIWVGGDAEVVLEDVTLTANAATGGDAATAGARQGGGGAYLDGDGATLEVRGGEIATNTAVVGAGSGGGILVAGGALAVDGTTFRANRADRAGGAIEVDTGTATVGEETPVTFLENRASGASSGAGNGGAVHAAGASTVALVDVVANGNVAVEGGAAWVGTGATLVTTGGEWVGNVALGGDATTAGERQGGGAVYNDGGTLDVDGGRFAGNRAVTGAGSGGAFLLAAGSTTIDGAEVVGNTADRAGGGIENDGGALVVGGDTPVTLTGNRATGTNSGAGNGGGLHALAGTIVAGGTIAANAAVEGGGVWSGGADTTVTLDGVTVEANTATGGDASTVGGRQGGGGVYVDAGELVLDQGAVRDNVATIGNGSGGGALVAAAGTLTVTGTAFTTNTAARAGGGVENDGGTVVLTNAVLGGNVASGAGDAAGNGGGVHASDGATTVNGGTVNGGEAVEGGGLWVGGAGVLTLDNVAVQGNVATGDAADQGGGGLYVDGAGAMATVTGGSFVSANDANGAAGSGGGLFNNGGTLEVEDGTLVRGNRANRAGGGIEVVGGTTTVELSTLESNGADGGGDGPGSGGGVHVTGGDAAVAITTTTLTGNAAAADGGGLWNDASDVVVSASTFVGNVVGGAGGAVYDRGGTTSLTNTTLSANTAAAGGGVFATTGGAVTLQHVTSFTNVASAADGGNELATAGGTIAVSNSIVVDAREDATCTGDGITSGGGNYVEANCDVAGTDDVEGNAPMLAPLAVSAGTTATHDPVDEDSPVVDATTSAVAVDQRGVSRPQPVPPLPLPLGDMWDIGAVELEQELLGGLLLGVR